MIPERWQKVKEIFNEAVELKLDEREKFLDEAINGDDEMRLEVEKLLAADEVAKTDFPSFAVFPPETVKDVIGNYRIIKKIGEGGMGAVYLAERADLKQKVALKIIRHGADSDVILRRFRREQEILAALEHPNIARLLDVGISADNVPFLAMEYVEGVDLTTFSNDRNLSVNEKLNLFRKICEAVAYAHSRLVVHRDLKPSNIIVNSKGEPKLLDFGISKLLDEAESEADEKGTVTSFGMLTPNYASPEQFRGETVSTATDVYSLGVILYELLTDRLPYDVNSRRLDEVARIVCETEPERPSSVVSQQLSVSSSRINDEKLTAENVRRTKENQPATNPKSKTQNPKLLRGDLDNIILKALRKEPERRYSSVEKFSEDVRRHLVGLPVTARRDTFSYRAEKFVARNRVAVASAALVFLVLLAGVAGISWQYVRAERQRVLAERRFGEVRQLANNVVFKYHDEIANLQGATKVRETLITDGLQYLDGLAREAGGDATLSTELGQAYLRIGNLQGGAYQGNTGNTAAAIESYQKALALFENVWRENPSANVKAHLSEAHKKLGLALRKSGDKAANGHFQTAVALNEELLVANPNDNPQKIQTAQAYVNLCRVLPKGLAAGESVEMCRRALPLLQAVYAETPDDKAVLSEMQTTDNILGIQFGMMADAVDKTTDAAKSKEYYRTAADYFRDAANIVEKLAVIEPANAVYRRSIFATRLNESTARLNSGESAAALDIQQRLLENAEKESAADRENAQAQQDVASTLSQIGLTQIERKEFPAAHAQFVRASTLLENLIGKDAANREIQQDCFNNYIYAGDAQNGERDYEAARKTYRAAFGFAQNAAKLKDSPFVGFAEGLMHEKIGGSLLAEAENATNGERKRLYQTAREAFQKALLSWKTEESAPEKFGLSDETVAATQKKIAECEAKAAL